MDSVFASANTAVITGGASGIGLAIAAKCRGYGMKVVIADRNVELLKTAKAVLGEGVTTFEGDVASVEDWAKLREVVARELAGEVFP